MEPVQPLDNSKLLQGDSTPNAPSASQTVGGPSPALHVNGHHTSESLRSEAHEFLQKFKLSFGESSEQSRTIHKILGEFQVGKLAKRDVYTTIIEIVGSHSDLKQSLQNIICHRDANWGPQDFDQEIPDRIHSNEPSPEFLQPPHMPQLPIPIMSAPWYSNQRVQNSQPEHFATNPATHNTPASQQILVREAHNIPSNDVYMPTGYGYAGFRGFENHKNNAHSSTYENNMHSKWTPFTQIVPSSPISQLSAQSQPLTMHMSPKANSVPNFTPFVASDHEIELKSPLHNSAYENLHANAAHGSWQEAHFRPAWLDTEIHYNHDPRRTLAENHSMYSPSSSFDYSVHQSISPGWNSSNAIPAADDPPLSFPNGRTAFDMPPPTQAQTFEASTHGGATVGTRPFGVQGHAQTQNDLKHPPPPASLDGHMIQQNDKQYRNSTASNDRKPSSQGNGEFIHGLCGKAFSSRSGVKKHHWGGRMDNLATTTGCWAKHGKPNVPWNQHPSCKAADPKPRSLKLPPPTKPNEPQTSKFGIGTSNDPGTGQSSLSPIAGFPTLNGLPNLVAEALRNTSTSAYPSPREAMPIHDPHPPQQKNLDALFTAVNDVSKIDAPKPQGRNDSVISHLDTQAAATGHNGHYVPHWPRVLSEVKDSAPKSRHNEPRLNPHDHLDLQHPEPLVPVTTADARPTQEIRNDQLSPLSATRKSGVQRGMDSTYIANIKSSTASMGRTDAEDVNTNNLSSAPNDLKRAVCAVASSGSPEPEAKKQRLAN